MFFNRGSKRGQPEREKEKALKGLELDHILGELETALFECELGGECLAIEFENAISLGVFMANNSLKSLDIGKGYKVQLIDGQVKIIKNNH